MYANLQDLLVLYIIDGTVIIQMTCKMYSFINYWDSIQLLSNCRDSIIFIIAQLFFLPISVTNTRSY